MENALLCLLLAVVADSPTTPPPATNHQNALNSASTDQRDVEDRPFEREIFEKLGFKGEELERMMNLPRLVLARDHPNKNLWNLFFTYEVTVENIEIEVQRLCQEHKLNKRSVINTELHKGLIFNATEQQARKVSQDLKVRRVFEGRKILPVAKK